MASVLEIRLMLMIVYLLYGTVQALLIPVGLTDKVLLLIL
jgi:hypothetical protein